MWFLSRLFGKKDDPIRKLEGVISYRFRNRELVRTALRHRSFLKDTGLYSNERLEFLGDAVLGLVVSSFLYNQNNNHTEGDLTRMKATLVNETTLFKAASSFNLGEYIFISPEEENSGGRTKPSIIADAFEALIAAVFLDGGLEPAEKLIKEFILRDYLTIVDDKQLHNYKGEFLEYLQARGKGNPQYRVTEQFGPDHSKHFRVGVFCNDEFLGEGLGKSKKEAEQKAARQALKEMKNSSKKM